ncbi:MAG: Gfo/Idh/MocA family oxidoreductase [Pseudomonadota bacterium]
MIRVALLGAGIGQEHLRAYRALFKDFSVILVVDQNIERAEDIRNGDDYEIKDSIEDALTAQNVDLVDICLPPHLHLPVALRTLEAGKHVICEKPLATSLDGVAQIQMASETCGRSVFPVFQYRWGPELERLKHLVSAGITGRPFVASLETHWARGSDYYSVPWRGTWSGEMGGAVLGHAIHAHDILTHIFGPVHAVTAKLMTKANPIETEDCAAIVFEMQNGALATSSVTLGAAKDETRLRFIFDALTATSGSVPYAPGTGQWSFDARNASDQALINSALAEVSVKATGFQGFLTQVAAALHDRENSAVTLADGAASIELVSAIYVSARRNARVSLPLAADDPIRGGWQP